MPDAGTLWHTLPGHFEGNCGMSVMVCVCVWQNKLFADSIRPSWGIEGFRTRGATTDALESAGSPEGTSAIGSESALARSRYRGITENGEPQEAQQLTPESARGRSEACAMGLELALALKRCRAVKHSRSKRELETTRDTMCLNAGKTHCDRECEQEIAFHGFGQVTPRACAVH